MSDPASPDSWVCRHPEVLVLKSWPEGSVVYDSTDSSLHALTSVAADLLTLLLDGVPHNPVELAARLLMDDPRPDEVNDVRSQLVQFEYLGLLERCPP